MHVCYDRDKGLVLTTAIHETAAVREVLEEEGIGYEERNLRDRINFPNSQFTFEPGLPLEGLLVEVINRARVTVYPGDDVYAGFFPAGAARPVTAPRA